MNFNEACKILEISESATPEEAKKKFKEAAKKYHPDINKEIGAEEKFKKINQAYQIFSDGKKENTYNPFDENDMYNPFVQNNFDSFSDFIGVNFTKNRKVTNINISTNISFKESVLGCKKDLKYKRHIKCEKCHGNGSIIQNNGCNKCNGRGKITGNQGGMIFVRTCDKCHGKTSFEKCILCNGDGTLESETSINVSIPGGVVTNNILRLGNMGNYGNSFGPIDQYSDVHLTIIVEENKKMSLVGQDVISKLDISLLEALSGTNKIIETIYGDKEITINPLSKNKDEIIIAKMGVNGIGNQKIILNVNYPDNILPIIDCLKEEKK